MNDMGFFALGMCGVLAITVVIVTVAGSCHEAQAPEPSASVLISHDPHVYRVTDAERGVECWVVSGGGVWCREMKGEVTP